MISPGHVHSGTVGMGGVERVEMMVEACAASGKWRLDVRRSTHDESMRYQLDREGAAGSMCI